MWTQVSYKQEWYSSKPMELEGYYGNLAKNRRAELEQERRVLIDGLAYSQQGHTVSTRQWEQWISDHSVPEDLDLLQELDMTQHIPSDSIVTERVTELRTAFSKWLSVRQQIAQSLPKTTGKSYDNITADIHSRMIGTLEPPYPY